MNCETARQNLDALADGELAPWTTWRMRRHLAHCPACTAELAATHQLTEQARNWRNVTAPTNFAERALTPSLALAKRRIAWRPVAILSTCAVTVAAIALLLPGQPARPTVALADVERTVGGVQTAHWTFHGYRDVTHFPRPPFYYGGRYRRPASSASFTATVWVRMAPFAFASRSLDGGYRVENGHDTIDRFLWFSGDVYRRVHNTQDASQRKRQEVLTHDILAPGLDFGPSSHGMIVSPNRTGEPVTLGGRQAVKFQSGFDTTPSGLVPNAGPRTRRVTYTVWADAATKLILRTEARETDLTTSRLVSLSVTDHYHYNLAPLPGTFHVPSPPPGAQIERQTVN